MCIGLNRRSVPTGGFGSKHASNDAMLSRIAVKPDMLPLGALLRSSNHNHAAAAAAAAASVNKDAGKNHITVQHNYHDHADDMDLDGKRLPARGGVITPFPLKLHSMLEAVEKEGLEDIVSWQPHGRCFVVHDSKEMANILVKYFKVSKVSSFQRQLNLYGFQRLTKGQDKGGYYHELFLRGKVFLSQNIQRVKVKGTKIRARSNPEQEPNFYALPWILAQSNQQPAQTIKSLGLSASIMQDLEPVPLASMWDLEEAPLVDAIPTSMWEEEEVSASDADAFFEDFEFPQNPSDLENIENDDVFGDLLEQIVGA
jgi:hypothetical protein